MYLSCWISSSYTCTIYITKPQFLFKTVLCMPISRELCYGDYHSMTIESRNWLSPYKLEGTISVMISQFPSLLLWWLNSQGHNIYDTYIRYPTVTRTCILFRFKLDVIISISAININILMFIKYLYKYIYMYICIKMYE